MNNHPTALPVPKETKIVMAITPGQVFAFPELSRPLHTLHPKLRTATSSPPPLRLPQAAEATAPHVIPSFTLPPGPPSPSLEFDGMIFDPHEDSPLLLISRSGACRSFVALAKTNIEKQEEREERRRRGSSLPNVDGGRSWSEMDGTLIGKEMERIRRAAQIGCSSSECDLRDVMVARFGGYLVAQDVIEHSASGK
ncbi:hypothetical protein B296_00025964 [Ensete ventricosum]|uniref:Uncharacterized protein n=1 Tax=Ensete ventricosum TaxID=4639 RepID=A0A426Z8S2_ENSVE|nr:hypothetical protein B296_00025964 [Ensete ventricosum]